MKNYDIIYCDIDWVLHDFTIGFLESIKKLYGVVVTQDNFSKIMELEEEIESPLQQYSSYFNLTKEQIDHAIWDSNLKEKWCPTYFGEELADFLRKEFNNGQEIQIITSRDPRKGAVSILQQIFQSDKIPPVFSCDSSNKHLIIKENSIYFEDHWKVINNCAKYIPSTTVYVPEWPWNKRLVVDAPSIKLMKHEELLKEIIKLKNSREKNPLCVLNQTK